MTASSSDTKHVIVFTRPNHYIPPSRADLQEWIGGAPALAPTLSPYANRQARRGPSDGVHSYWGTSDEIEAAAQPMRRDLETRFVDDGNQGFVITGEENSGEIRNALAIPYDPNHTPDVDQAYWALHLRRNIVIAVGRYIGTRPFHSLNLNEQRPSGNGLLVAFAAGTLMRDPEFVDVSGEVIGAPSRASMQTLAAIADTLGTRGECISFMQWGGDLPPAEEFYVSWDPNQHRQVPPNSDRTLGF